MEGRVSTEGGREDSRVFLPNKTWGGRLGRTKISTANRTHARTGLDTQRAQANNHTWSAAHKQGQPVLLTRVHTRHAHGHVSTRWGGPTRWGPNGDTHSQETRRHT